MIFWLLCAALTAVGIMLILRPLLSNDEQNLAARDADLALYRDQLQEIDRDQERGLFNEEEAKAAKLEVSRRILATDDKISSAQSEPHDSLTDKGRFRIWSGAAGAVVVFAVGTYLALGSPGLPSQPHAERLAADPSKLPVNELIARVEANLKSNPRDARGWDVIAPIYLNRQEFRKAAAAYRNAIKLNGENPRRLAQLAEALLGATEGHVNDTVKDTYDRLLKLKPDYLPAHFWLAVRLEQKGDQSGAVKSYKKLLERSDVPAPMKTVINERLAVARGESPKPSASEKSSAAEAGKGAPPSRDSHAEMAQMSPAERQKRIRQMVDGLAERLTADGGDLKEWQRLIRSYTVIGDRAKAETALENAKKNLAKNANDIKALEGFAKSVGVGGEAVAAATAKTETGSETGTETKTASEAGKGAEPSSEARKEMAQLSPDKRQARIRQMVDGLAERLNADGGELQEWQRLIRSYTVLGDRAKAEAALEKAKKNLAKNENDVEALEGFAKSVGLGTAAVATAAAPNTKPTSEAGKGAAPSREAREEMARLSPDKRQARIRQMVEGLAERLFADGGDLQEWQRLIRSYTVLGDRAKAQSALTKARENLAKQPADVKTLETMAASIGLSTSGSPATK